jgi:hypothetical protein
MEGKHVHHKGTMEVSDKAYLTILRKEFTAENGSFLLQLRCDLRWDQEAFLRLTTAMERCCSDLENAEYFDRWLADGFWYLSFFVKSWASHENFLRELPDEYYRDAFQLLFDLASYFFTGSHPYIDRRFRFLDQISG